MRLHDLTQPLYEAPYGEIQVNPSELHPTGRIDVVKNPSKDVLPKLLDKWGATRAFLMRGSAIIWGVSPIHAEVARQLGLADNPYALPIILYADGADAMVQVTDYSRNTKWHENPQAANFIRNHPYMRKMFGDNIDIDYYNDAIVGDWEEL